MDDFPKFMKSASNKIATSSQATPGVEGYVFDGIDGSQMAFWTCRDTTVSTPHVHDYDEYMLVVNGRYTLLLGDNTQSPQGRRRIFHPQRTLARRGSARRHQTIHAFGGRRANREHQ